MTNRSIDYSVGFSQFCHIGDKLELDKPLAFVHANSQTDFEAASASLLKYITIEPNKVETPQVIIQRVSS